MDKLLGPYPTHGNDAQLRCPGLFPSSRRMLQTHMNCACGATPVMAKIRLLWPAVLTTATAALAWQW
eukprot:87885-Chlamydomonas_euryale.AAC.4